MSPLTTAAFAVLSAIAGTALGLLFARLRKPWWALGYLIALALIVSFAAAVNFPGLSVTPPILWMFLGRKKYAVLAFITTLALTTPLRRLPRRQDRNAVAFFMVAIVAMTSVWPCIAPLFSRGELERLKTTIDRDGICVQSTSYTCGPASAVTALHKLGFPAEEGRLAILSNTSSTGGTPDDELAEALQKEYGKDGLVAEFRVFTDLAELRQAGLTLAIVKYSLFVDHYVAVLEVTDTQVVVGDPLEGLRRLPYDEFLKKWRYKGVVLKRRPL